MISHDLLSRLLERQTSCSIQLDQDGCFNVLWPFEGLAECRNMRRSTHSVSNEALCALINCVTICRNTLSAVVEVAAGIQSKIAIWLTSGY